MTHFLRYGDGDIEIGLPDGRTDMISVSATAVAEESALVRDAIRNSTLPLRRFLGQSPSVAIVVSDHTRNTGSRIYMPILLDIAKSPGRKVTVLVACGLHRPSSKLEITGILGCDPGEGVVVMNHDPDTFLEDFGEGSFCRSVVQAERVVVTGSVTFHPMAGYSGGWKSILPGLASRACIIENHGLYFSGAEEAHGIGPASVTDNPILADIRQRTHAFASKTWCLNVVQDESKAIVHASAGQVDQTWESCADYLGRHYSPRIERRYPFVVASSGGYPSDFSFYQSMKTLTNASRACAKGGLICLVMECRNGWELDGKLQSLAGLELEEIALRLKEDFSMGGLAIYMALSVIRKYRVYCFSSLPEREVRGLGMGYIPSAQYISTLVDAEMPDRIAVMPAAAVVLPALAEL